MMKLYGIFIGVDNYADPYIPRLNYARADAKSFYELVMESLDPSECHLQLLVDIQATKLAVAKAIGEDLSRMSNENDIVLLFFSGHGSPETSGSIDKVSRYLILHDTDYNSIFATGLDMERELPRICFERIRAGLVLVFVDACFSGHSGGKTFRGPQFETERMKQGIRTAAPIKLSEMDLGEGRLIMSASDDDEVARESHELRHGVFTHFLIDTLASQTSKDKYISVPTLYDQVSDRVVAYTKGRQHPILNGRTRLGRLPMFVSPKALKK
jgi:uncharacterized caspase-like protein